MNIGDSKQFQRRWRRRWGLSVGPGRSGQLAGLFKMLSHSDVMVRGKARIDILCLSEDASLMTDSGTQCEN